MLRMGLAISGKRFEIGTDRLPDTGLICILSDLRWSRLAMPKHFLEAIDRYIESDVTATPTQTREECWARDATHPAYAP